MPACSWSNSPVRWVSLPTPDIAIEIVPGDFLARSISCGRVVMPSAGSAAINIGCSAMNPIGRKSRGRISGRFGATVGSATKVDSDGVNSV